MTSKGWRDSTPRFLNVPKPVVDRPVALMPPENCWCGEDHGFTDEGVIRTHWEAMDDSDDS